MATQNKSRVLGFMFALCLVAQPSFADERSKVVGLWKLVSYEVEVQATGQKEPVMGQNPTGYANFLPEGRVFFILTGEGRKPAKSDQERADLLGTLVAYTGTYRIEGDKWITKVEVAWNPEWVGTEQARSFKIDGDRLQVLTPWRVMPNWVDKGMTRSIVTFERATAATADAQQTSDPRVADLVRAGKVRFGTFPPQYTKDPTTGELRGPWVEVMRAVAAHMGLAAVLTELPTPSKLVECLETGPCDVGSLGFDPTRADQVGGFTPPFMQVEYTYLVPSGSALHSVADVDRPGVRVAVVRNHASTLALNRIAKHAEQVGAETPDDAFDLLRSGRVDAWASVRPALLDYSAKLSGSRVLEDSYGANFPALVVPKGQPARLAYLSEFVEAAKASGVVQRAIDRAGQPGYRVAEPAKH